MKLPKWSASVADVSRRVDERCRLLTEDDGVGKGHAANQLSHRIGDGRRQAIESCRNRGKLLLSPPQERFIFPARYFWYMQRAMDKVFFFFLFISVCVLPTTHKIGKENPEKKTMSLALLGPSLPSPKRCDSRKRAAHTQPLTKWPLLRCLTCPSSPLKKKK